MRWFWCEADFTVDEEDDKSIYNHREDAEKKAEDPKPLAPINSQK